MVMKKSLMVLGTASGVGKSTVALALCRYLRDKGLSVAPFKGLNMARHGRSTNTGEVIGQAQYSQAKACGIAPTGLMNPVFLRVGTQGTDLLLNGIYHSTLPAGRASEHTELMRRTACEAYDALSAQYDVIVMEGSGSCAEFNLKDQDVANLFMADYADADIILVADIDRGGVFASVVGTLGLMDEQNRRRVKGVIINRFRGDPARLEEAKQHLEFITGTPVLGIVPYFEPGIEAEDDLGGGQGNTEGILDVAVIHSPNMASLNDIMPLAVTPGIGVRHIRMAAELGSPHLIFLPGLYSSLDDARHVMDSGIGAAILRAYDAGSTIFGICGGLQMLGRRLYNPHNIEGDIPETAGLGLFDYTTTFTSERVVRASVGEALLEGKTFAIAGRETHCGHTDYGDAAPFTTFSEDGSPTGVSDPDRRLYATYVHGIFESRDFTQTLVDSLLRRYCPGERIVVPSYADYLTERYDAIRDTVIGALELSPLGF
jgi:adenosylcobyric acid synthase